MKKIFLLPFLLAGIAMIPVGAQQNKPPSLDDQYIIYKWQENGTDHYAGNLPRGVKQYTMLNQYGMEVTKERPGVREKKPRLMRPPKPPKTEADATEQKKAKTAAKKQDKKGVITRKQRCDKAQQDITLLSSQKTIYEEDEGQNLVPLDQATVSERLDKARKAAGRFCSDN